MLFPKPLARIKLWLGVTAVLILAALYFLTQYDEFLDEEDIPKPLPVFKWLPMHNMTFLDHCRNSQQGNSLIVDELGYVCPLNHVLKSGCCQVESRTTHDQRFECGSCNGNGCCEVYEHCVSCCMHPNKLPLLHSILSRNTEAFHPLYSSLKDQFELCLSKCRTSSQSVQHENAYRNPLTKFCYGTDTPTIFPEA